MGVSSKKRGRQRKAAAKAAGNSTASISENILIHTKIWMGDNKAVKRLLSKTEPLDQRDLSAVLDLLKKCEDETFHQVLSTLNGDLISPVMWINVLSRVTEFEPSISLQIAKNISPLVRCFCNDTERLFFKSNKHWREGIKPFVQLVSTLICNSIDSINTDKKIDKEIVNTVLQYEGLLQSIIQWGFWKDQRPDIVKILSVEDCDLITKLGLGTIIVLVVNEDNFTKDEADELTQDSKKRLRSIGTSPIVSKDYDPNRTTSFVVGFIRLVKEEGSWQSELNSSVLDNLIGAADCVDKDVIKEVIDLGTNYASDLESTELAAKSLSDIFYVERNGDSDNPLPCETRIAFAIRAGLIEMCLNFIRRFGWHESFLREKDHGSLNSNIWYILTVISEVSLHKKTAKALRHKKDEIQNQQARLETIATYDTNVQVLFDMVECILENVGSYCCRCNKSLSRTEVMECNGCHRMTYCSRSCQKEDWFNGHNLTCCKSYTDETAGQFQGRVLPRTATEDEKDRSVLTYDKDGNFQGSVVQPVVPQNERAATKLVELEKNITMIQLKLFLDNSETIVSKAKALNLPLYDCVAVFDLRFCPAKVEVKKYTDHYMPKAAWFRKSQSKENITCIYNSIVFNGAYSVKDDEVKLQIYNVPKLSMQRMFPHEWLLNWKDY